MPQIQTLLTCQHCNKEFKRKSFYEKHKEICNDLTCQFCKKQYINEVSFFNHVCEKKRRHIEKDEKHVKIAFICFKHYCTKTNRLNKYQPSYDDFIDSSLYKEFISFGKHLININVSNHLGFVDFLIKMQTPLKKWSSVSTYEIYMRELNKNETPLQALERNILVMQQWSINTGEDWTEFFKKISTQTAVLWIKSGKISPWLLFSASSASDLLSRMNQEQLEIVNNTVDAGFWELKIKRHQEDMKYIQKELSEAGI
jgi:hypothetical protein